MAVGRARVLYPLRFEADPAPVPPDRVDAEIRAAAAAFAEARAEIDRLRARVGGLYARELTEFIDAHALILDDPLFAEGVHEHIRRERLSASAALKRHRDELATAFGAIADPYLQSRIEDIDQVIARVHAALRRGDAPAPAAGSDEAGAGVVLVCESLAPAELDAWHERGLVAVVAVRGSEYSHSAILARGLRIPYLCGAAGALERIRERMLVLVDAERGEAVLQPDPLDLARLREYQRQSTRAARRRAAFRRVETRTADGVPIALWANAEHAADIARARRLGAAGVGLFRSEFLCLCGEPAAEDVQFKAYREAVLGMAGKPVTLRTFDLGADKAGLATAMSEANPALGLRGLRASLADCAAFVTQLRAMLRASAYGPVRILLPMVTAIDEIATTRRLIAQCRAELAAAGHPVAEQVALGGMIEVPGAALLSYELAQALDFLAIGSNDLVQYTLATDRNNASLGALYDPLHPAVIRLIYLVVENARQARKPLMLCGELAADARFTPLLLALGLGEMSMHPNALLEVRERIAGLSRKAMRSRVRRILAAANSAEIAGMVGELTPPQAGGGGRKHRSDRIQSDRA